MRSRSELAPAIGASTESESVGRYLCRQRQLRGISLAELARQTRIPERSLERLEAGTFDREADGFVRGFVRTVAQALGLDPDDTVARMLSEVRMMEDGPSRVSLSLRRVALVLGLALVGVAAVGGIRSLLAEPPAPPLASGSGSGSGSALGSGSGAETVYRRDPVRSLAEAVASSAMASSQALETVAEPRDRARSAR